MKKGIISKLIIVIFFFILIYIFQKIGIQEIIQSIAKANLIWILVAFLSIGIMFLFWSVRWKFLLRSKLPLTKFFMLNLVGTFICTITPTAGAGGEPVKAYYVAKMEKRSFTNVLIITILDKVVFNNLFFVFAIFASLFYAFLSIRIPLEVKTFLLTLLLITFITAMIIFIAKANWHNVKKPLTWLLLKVYSLAFVNKRFKTFDHFKDLLKKSAIDLFRRSKESLSSRKILVPALFHTIVAWLFFYFSFYAIFLAIGVPISIFSLFVIITISKLVGDLAFIPGGIGITESTLLGLFILFSVNPVAAATVTIIQRGLFYFYSLVLGYTSFSYLGFKLNQDTKNKKR